MPSPLEELLGLNLGEHRRKEITIPPHYSPDRPDIGDLQHPMRDKYNEQLTEPLRHADPRHVAVKERAPVLEPDYNRLYGYGRSLNDWRYFIDCSAKGTFTTVANAAITQAVTLAASPNWRLSQWPAAINAFLCIRRFSMAAQSAIGTVGAIDVVFQDAVGGFTIPMGDFVSNASVFEDTDVLIPTPIVDPANVNIGTLTVTLTGTTPTVSVYNWQMAFSVAYLLPSLEGYSVESIHRVLKKDASNE